MENKKNESVCLENKKNIFLQIGFVVALMVVYQMFEYNTIAGNINNMSAVDTDSETLDMLITIQTPPEQISPPLPVQVATELNLMDNNTDIEDDDIQFDSEPSSETVLQLTKVKTVAEETIINIAEKMPEFPGGNKNLLKYLSNTIKYPLLAIEQGIVGKVYVRFVVTKEGNIENVSIARTADPLLEQEAIRVIKSLPKWKPGEHGGRKVNVWYTLPINFTLNY